MRISYWVLSNLGAAALIYAGFFMKIDGFRYVFYVYCSIHILSCLVCFSEDAAEKCREKGPAVNINLNLFSDLFLGGAIAFVGHPVLSFFYILTGLMHYSMYSKEKNNVESTTK